MDWGVGGGIFCVFLGGTGLGFLDFLEILDFLDFLDFRDFLDFLEILAPSHKTDGGVLVCTPPSCGGFSLGRVFVEDSLFGFL